MQEEEVDVQALVERERAIRQLQVILTNNLPVHQNYIFYFIPFQSDIVDVNTIFKELATMVHEQGEMIDSIEANVETAQMRVEEGTSQSATCKVIQKMET